MKILLVEDSRVLRERLRSLIADIPGAVLVGEADNDGDAMHCLTTQRPDTVVLDLKLKQGSGLSVLEYIKAQYPDVRVLVLTNYGQAEYKSKCMELGADNFFDKNRDFEVFAATLLAIAQATQTPVTQANTGAAL